VKQYSYALTDYTKMSRFKMRHRTKSQTRW